MNYTYLLRCADDSLYCGWTNHLEQRIKMHNSGKGAKYTKSRRPVALAYFEAWNTKEEAMKREAAIKKMTKNKKEALAAELRIIISPAKKMQVRTDYLPWKNMPVFLDRTQVLKEKLQSYSEQELKKLFSANDSITHENYLRYRDMDLTRRTFICWDPVSIYGSPSVFRRTVAVHRKTSADSERLLRNPESGRCGCSIQA